MLREEALPDREAGRFGLMALLMSHNDQWIKSVRRRCEYLDGIYYDLGVLLLSL